MGNELVQAFGAVALSQMLTLFAFGALFCNGFLLLGLLSPLARQESPMMAEVTGLGRRVSPSTARALIGWAALLAIGATLGSLYLSEIEHLAPCRWCWFQRIAMYPLAVLLAVAWLTRDGRIFRYGLPLSLVGLAMSTWHYLLQRFPSLEGTDTCSVAVPCAVRYANEFNFISIPYMAGSVFALISAILWRLRTISNQLDAA